ncbi:hypothetical protein SAMN04489737_0258 [Arcanobacterium phocae]|uniref:RiboL-PSP-HEPN domain-containing protein n=1 Tax=Arcanobacterium phocae TaxID=131112 RepID=A0A1H2LBM6_9ACTO|nr:hypothetical protein [Arcanobacterium phocae]SDU77961.1 hypothetical protein SAMN04489737_0258 [Arcanobacterium phocae]
MSRENPITLKDVQNCESTLNDIEKYLLELEKNDLQLKDRTGGDAGTEQDALVNYFLKLLVLQSSAYLETVLKYYLNMFIETYSNREFHSFLRGNIVPYGENPRADSIRKRMKCLDQTIVEDFWEKMKSEMQYSAKVRMPTNGTIKKLLDDFVNERNSVSHSGNLRAPMSKVFCYVEVVRKVADLLKDAFAQQFSHTDPFRTT